jgi:hypothetical protein
LVGGAGTVDSGRPCSWGLCLVEADAQVPPGIEAAASAVEASEEAGFPAVVEALAAGVRPAVGNGRRP